MGNQCSSKIFATSRFAEDTSMRWEPVASFQLNLRAGSPGRRCDVSNADGTKVLFSLWIPFDTKCWSWALYPGEGPPLLRATQKCTDALLEIRKSSAVDPTVEVLTPTKSASPDSTPAKCGAPLTQLREAPELSAREFVWRGGQTLTWQADSSGALLKCLDCAAGEVMAVCNLETGQLAVSAPAQCPALFAVLISTCVATWVLDEKKEMAAHQKPGTKMSKVSQSSRKVLRTRRELSLSRQASELGCLPSLRRGSV